VILGFPAIELGIEFLLVWMVCVFVSILVHELGHVLMGRLFGAQGHIVLYSFGGLAVGSSDLSSRWQRIAVYFAGPLAGFVLFGLVLLAKLAFFAGTAEPPTLLVASAFQNLFFINLWWGLVNLLPIFPLDGGQISRDFLRWLWPRDGLQASLGLSVLTAAAVAVLAGVYLRSWYMALLFGLLAVQSFQALRQLRQTPWQEEPQPWERDADDWRVRRW
jgi:stage IV sporulation protein FB